MSITSLIYRAGVSVRHVLFPSTCAVCGRIVEEDAFVCGACREDMEPVRLDSLDENALTRQFMFCGHVVRAASLLRYHPNTMVAQLLTEIKYHHRPALARHLGRWMAQELVPRGMFEGVDALVPLPLTPGRKKERGYNQSEQLALGISSVTGIAVRADLVKRTTFRISQTHLTATDRRRNVEGVFAPTDVYQQALSQGTAPRHPLLIDDVITTGSSLSALASVIEAPDISILSLALAGQHSTVFLSDEEIQREISHETTRTSVYFDE